MPNFQTCKNGHNYDSSLYAACPYCPVNADEINYKKTLSDFKSTQSVNESQQFEKTIIDEAASGSAVLPNKSAEQFFKQTQIVMDGENIARAVPQTERRKLIGWLVTFDSDPAGRDFKLYTGRNKIGTDDACDIVLNDPSVSGEHTTIFFRENEFLIKDNFSTNGTKLNGKLISEGRLKEGDELQLGSILFKFKTVF